LAQDHKSQAKLHNFHIHLVQQRKDGKHHCCHCKNQCKNAEYLFIGKQFVPISDQPIYSISSSTPGVGADAHICPQKTSW
jgi:hypothetical protein